MKKISIRGQMFLQILKKAKYGTVELKLPDGRVEQYGSGSPLMKVEVKNWQALELLFSKGDLGLTETIIEGTIVVDDVAALVEWACRNDQELGQVLHGAWYGTLMAKIKNVLSRHDRASSKKQIMSHYDLGNEFYKLWLDPTMAYSSAIFTSPSQSLEQAQVAKYDRIIETLNIKPGDRLLEIGCGWGGFFSHAIERTGCHVTAVMNSPEQARYNQEKVDAAKMTNHVSIQQMDYRDIKGKFDKVVSIEMIEAVGEKNWDIYFEKVKASMTSHGQALIQGITIREDLFYSYRKSTDFIQQYVFPGGMLPTTRIFQEKGIENGMNVADIYEFGQHYADTLRVWRQNFNKALPHVRAMGFDEKFIRMWNLYLAYCEGAFRAQRINVGQYLMAT